VKINGFLLRPEKLNGIPIGGVGLSSFSRDMMQISKLDDVIIEPKKVREPNLLDMVELILEKVV